MTKPTSSELRRIRSHAAKLKARITVGKAGLTEGVIAQVRHALQQTSIVKVRVDGQDRDAIDAFGEKLAEQVPCVLVSRVGFVLTLFSPGKNNPLTGDDEPEAE